MPDDDKFDGLKDSLNELLLEVRTAAERLENKADKLYVKEEIDKAEDNIYSKIREVEGMFNKLNDRVNASLIKIALVAGGAGAAGGGLSEIIERIAG